MKSLKFIDLFSGLGGFRIALENHGGQCVFSSDIDKYARETYLDNFGEEPSGDITKIASEAIPDHDILCAGFPCQPFSLGGRRQGFEDTRGTLFFDVARIISDKKPKIFFLENVAGLVSQDNGKTLEVITRTLKNLGYIVEWRLMNAKDFGVPQNRNRWYCIGYDAEIYKESIDMNSVFPNKQQLEVFLDSLVSTEELEEYQISERALLNIEKHLPEFKSSGRNDTRHYIIANHIRPSKVSFSSTGISPCLTAKMGTGGNNVPVIYELQRKLTERECLRLMGFPETYKIKKNYSQSYKQIGNSVVVSVIEQIMKNIVSIFFSDKISSNHLD